MSRSLIPSRRFVGRTLFALAAVSLLLMGGAVTGCMSVASKAEKNFQPVHQPLTADQRAVVAAIPNYLHPEEATYLTFPEWYLVFNPQELAEFLRTRPPSEFAWFKSIGQLWTGYGCVYGVTRHNYPFNYGNHLMVLVIGVSTTGEYTIKGVYENTVGRLSELTAGGATTTEDAYSAKIAREYGAFVPTKPWFEFPFGRAFRQLWTTNPFFGPHFPRKLERKIFLSLEYGVKFLYAGLIRVGSHAVYGVAETEIYATITHAPETIFDIPGVKKIRPLDDGTVIITVPHYQGFTDTVPLLARAGADFRDIAGNDEILVTLHAPAGWRYDLSAGRVLFSMDLLNQPGMQRFAVQVPVRSLGAVLRELDAKHLTLEHLFDY